MVSFNYGRIEGEPSFPLTNFGGDSAREGGSAPGPRGVMGNAQTHCVQLPNTFAFARGAKGLPVTENDYLAFAQDLIPGCGPIILEGWKALNLSDPTEMRARADALDAPATTRREAGPLGGLLFGDPGRFLRDLSMMLHMRADYAALQAADSPVPKTLVRSFAQSAAAWQKQHGYENSWWWPDLDETLRKVGASGVNAVLDSQMNPWAAPKGDIGMTPFEYVADSLRRAESFTPRLLAALREAGQ